MQLREVYIDGFGIFNDKQIPGFTPGINLVYGPNEFGKTTFLEFIRRILFGFPAKRGNINPYPALLGGRYGGRLICELSNSDEISVHRTEGTHGGHVIIQIGSSELTGQDELNRLLGSISKTFYENVYAFSLNELQEIDSLSDDEIRNRIYGAGLELGGKSLTTIKKVFTDHGDPIFKPSGKKHLMNHIYDNLKKHETNIREIQKGLEEFEELKDEKERLEAEIEKLENEIQHRTELKYNFQNMQKLYTNVINLKTTEAELDGLEDIKDFPEDALDTYTSLNSELDSIREKIDEKEVDKDTLTSKCGSLSFNEPLIKVESTVISLQELSKKYSSSFKDYKTVDRDNDNLKKEVEKAIKNLGENWSDEKIRNFELGHKQNDKLNDLKSSLNETQLKLHDTNVKLEQHLDLKSAKTTSEIISLKFYKKSHLIITVMGVLGVIIGILSSQWTLVGFSVAFALIGWFVGRKLKSRDSIQVVDPVEKRLRDQLDESKKNYNDSYSNWENTLNELGFEEVSPSEFEKMLHSIDKIKSDLSSINEYEYRLTRMQSTFDEVKELHDGVKAVVDDSTISDNIETNIKIFSQLLTKAKEIKNQKDSLQEQINELDIRISSLDTSLKDKEKEIQDYISSIRAENFEDMKHKDNILNKKNELSGIINDETNIIQSAVGGGKHFEKFIENISESTPDKIDAEIEVNKGKLTELSDQRTEINQNIGKLQNKIDSLSSNDELLRNQNELEINKTLLKDTAGEWVKSKIALNILEKAISKYENTRQPDVINTAKDVFSNITNSQYPTVQMQAESQELIIKDSTGNSKKVTEMSRGTLEELYFSMRLGLVEEYEKRVEPMPFVMDDTFVNFDDERGQLAIEALNRFAKDRQVIVLTCHKSIMDIFKSTNATIITIE